MSKAYSETSDLNNSKEEYCTLQEIIDACNEAGIPIGNLHHEPNQPQSCHYQEETSLINLTSASSEIQQNAIDIPSVAMELQRDKPESPGDFSQGRKRSKRADKTTWQKQKEKQKRQCGESYMASETISVDPSTKKRKRAYCSKRVPAKRIGPNCSSRKCLKSSKRHCGEFSHAERERIFGAFWKEMTWSERKEHVISLIDSSKPMRRREKHSGLKRSDTFLYHLKKNGIRLQVCKLMFLNTLGIGDKQVRGWVLNRKNPREPKMTEKRPTLPKHQFATQFLTMLPKLPSHYCRKSSSKLYLEPLFNSKRHVFKEYKNYCKNPIHEEDKTPRESVSWGTFYKLFERMNIGLYQPKKDWCDTCSSHQAGNVSDEDWTLHMKLKDTARLEKSNDKKKAFADLCHLICVDLQAVQLCPNLNASSLYYKTKLLVHNYTVYDLKTRNAKCYLFDETQGELSASVFASCLVNYLEKFNDGKPIIIYSDGCTNQNRNAMLSTALLDLAIRRNIVITQKFLEKGHTQMEVDSVHSAIERQMKNKSIYLPTDYVDVCKNAREDPEKYEVEYLNYQFFKNYAIPKLQWYSSIRPGTKSGDKCVVNLRQLQYEPVGLIKYKLDFSEEWLPLPRAPSNLNNPQFPCLYTKQLCINKRKFKDLQDLLHVLPKSSHEFYKNIPTS